MDLPVLWGEFFMGGLFTVKIISVNLPPHFTVNMPPSFKQLSTANVKAYHIFLKWLFFGTE